ncbi:MAG: AAA family ATPase [Chloroflexi bacterium]|nr:AAA family ATPase [Chloroflexota bacterium]
MSDVFISYVEEDADVVEPLALGLSEAGYSCWYYQRSSLPGASYLAQISEALAQAKVVLLMLSHQTLESHQVDKEISFTHDSGKPFLPVTRNLAWGEFQQRRPTWRLAMGTSVAILIPSEGVGAIVGRVVEGLRGLRVTPTGSRLVAAAAVPSETATPAPTVHAVASTAAQASTAARRLAPAMLASRAALVGRAAELARLKAELDAVASGEGGRLILIGGDPGVGKTRLAQEVGLYAWSKGGLLLEGSYLRETSVPLRTWVEALRPALRNLDRGETVRLVGSYGAELGQIFPDLTERLGQLPAVAPATPEEQRLRRFDAITQLITGLSLRTPLVLILNDLQWMPGLGLLTHVARQLGESRALVIGTYRKHELKQRAALTQGWAELNRTRLASHLLLQPLPEAEAAELIERYFGPEPARQLRDPIYRRTKGNPFFLEEVIHSLSETGVVRATVTGWEVLDPERISIPDTIKSVVAERVDRLGELGREVLTQAAVLGQEFSLPVLQALTGKTEDELLDVLERAILARLLVDRSVAGEERFAFADDQVQEVLYESIASVRRRRAHLKAGQAIAAIYAGRLQDRVEDLAYHYLAGNDLELAITYALEAGERAFNLSVWSRAITHFETALEQSRQLPEDLPRRAHILERLVEMEWVTGRPGLGHSAEAIELFTRLGDKRKAAWVHGLAGRAWASGSAGRCDSNEALVHHEAAVALLESEPDSPEKAFALSRLGFSLAINQLELDRGLAYLEQASAIAERLGDPNQATIAYLYLGVPLAHRGELARAKQVAFRSLEVAASATDPWAKVGATYSPIAMWPWLDDRDWADQWLRRYAEYRERYQVWRFDRPLTGIAALAAALQGQPAKAIEALRRADELTAQRPQEYRFFLYSAGAAHEILGNQERAAPLFAEALESGRSAPAYSFFIETSLWLGRFLLDRGDLDEASRVLTEAESLVVDRRRVVQELRLQSLWCELHVRRGELERAEVRLHRAREILVRPEDWRTLTANVHRAAGLLAAARAHWPEAERSFAQAHEIQCAHGFPYNKAKLLAAWAEMYFQRNEPGDVERGLEKLNQSLAIFERCQAKRDIQTVRARRAAFAG